LLSKNVQIKTNRTIILPAVLYGYETWPLTLRDELRLRVFENRVLKIIFGRKGNEVRGNGLNYIMSSLVTVLLTKYSSLDKIKKNEMGGACSK